MKANLLVIFLAGYIAIILSSCAAAGTTQSPLSVGYSIHVAPGLQLGESKTSVHAVAGYENIWFNGGGGKITGWQFGGQLRQFFGDNDGKGFWAGGEITYLRLRNKFDNSSVKQTANGISFAPIAGYRFEVANVPVSFYAAPGILRRGKYTTGGNTGGSGSTNFLGRIGFDIHFASLLSGKGR